MARGIVLNIQAHPVRKRRIAWEIKAARNKVSMNFPTMYSTMKQLKRNRNRAIKIRTSRQIARILSAKRS